MAIKSLEANRGGERVNHFYLGAHHPSWLASFGSPLFVSRRSLYKRKTFPRAIAGWGLDSSAFTEISMNGDYSFTARQYADEVNRFADEIGNLRWASSMDYMCEPFILEKTGCTVLQHQKLTIDNYLRLRDMDTRAPIVPVLQGFEESDYLRHVEMYDRAGVNLQSLPLVGLGSICRRQATGAVLSIIVALYRLAINLHCFGLKLTGLFRAHPYIESGDSMAWSYDARLTEPLPGCTHKSCANCIIFARRWLRKVDSITRQGCLFAEREAVNA